MLLTVYSKNRCPYCDQAKALLKNKGIKFEEIRIDEMCNAGAREFIMEQGHRTVPQIYFQGKLFVEGGFQGLSKLSTDEIRTRMGLTENLGTL
jgi:glutaredoxin 3